MALTSHSITVRRAPAMRSAASMVIAAVLAAWAAPVAAQSAAGAGLRMTELEVAFWVCDHAATTTGVDRTTAITCAGLTDTLKLRKFNGDFNAMLSWWREHKEAQYVALAAAGGAASAHLAPAGSR